MSVSPSSSSWRIGAVSECVRLYLHDRRVRVHSTAIKGAIHKCIQPYFDAIDFDDSGNEFDVVNCLDNLVACGDIYRQANGYWKACPMRLVQISGNQDVLVIGGAPTSHVRSQLEIQPVSYGRARIVSSSSIPATILDNKDIWVPAGDWLCTPDLKTDDWAEKELARAELHLTAGFLEGAEDMEVYLPDHKCMRIYQKRWVALTQALEHCGRPRLCRAALYNHGRGAEFFIVKVTQAESDNPQFSSVRIDRDAAMRISYGIDVSAGNPLKIPWQNLESDEFVLEIYRSWPRAEARILSLGELLPKTTLGSGKQYLFSKRLAPLIEDTLIRLGMATLKN